MNKEPRKNPLGSLRKKLSRSFRRESKISDGLSPLCLQNLPPELILCLMDYLTTASAAALSITCRRFESLLGDEYVWKAKLFSSIEERDEILEVIGTALPSTVACSCCQKLHTMKSLYQSENRTTNLARQKIEGERTAALLCPSIHNAATVRYGNWKNKFLYFMFTMEPIIEITPEGLIQLTHDHFRTNRLHECIVHRRQSVWMSLENLSASAFEGQNTKRFAKSNTGPSNFYICAHIKLTKKLVVGGLVQRGRCSECYTEFCLGFKHYDSRGHAFFVTVWQDLGLRPEENEWQPVPVKKACHYPPRGTLPFLTHETICVGNNVGPPLQNWPQLGKISQEFENSSRTYQFDWALSQRPEYQHAMFMLQSKHWMSKFKIPQPIAPEGVSSTEIETQFRNHAKQMRKEELRRIFLNGLRKKKVETLETLLDF